MSAPPPRRGWPVVFAALAVVAPAVVAAAAPEPAARGRFEKDGVVVELTVSGEGAGPRLLQGDRAQVRFRVTSAATGREVRGLRPAAWLDVAGAQDKPEECRERVALYLKGLVGVRPLVDLNSYHLLVLNGDPSISVIDPIVGMTGKTSLYATILLERAAADWAKTPDGKRLHVSLPRAGKVAVIDVDRFQVAEYVPAGKDPTRVAIQADGKYVWVGNDAPDVADSGVTVIDAETSKVAARIRTGRGHHEIAFAAGDRTAFVTNRADGTVSVIDVATLRKVRDVKTGPVPISVARSPLSQAVYVADGKDGSITVLHPDRHEPIARIAASPGLGPLRFSPDGRWGFAVNPTDRAAYVIDAAENRLLHRIEAGGQPYQVQFTRGFAYLRLLDSERVAMVNLGSIGEGKKPMVQHFAAGAKAPKLARDLSIADSIARAQDEAAVFVVSPADAATYYYTEGMNAPMGSFGSYGHDARAVQVVDRGLKEVEPGVYSGTLRLPVAGKYDLAFLLDAPRALHCFGFEADANPALAKDLGVAELQYVDAPLRVAAGEGAVLRFKLADPATHAPLGGLGDVQVLHFVTPGGSRRETPAREVGDGLYEARLALPEPGAYYLYVGARSLKLRYGDLPYRTLAVQATSQEARR